MRGVFASGASESRVRTSDGDGTELASPPRQSNGTGTPLQTQSLGSDQNKDASHPAVASCRVCLEEDCLENFCQPCSCTGSMSHAHPACIQNWINEKGDMLCEICKQPYCGNFQQPPPQAAGPPGRPFVGADTGHQEEDFNDRLTPLYGVAAIMVITLLLFVHHIAEVVIGPAYQQSGKTQAPARPEFTDGGVTFSWGSLNRSDWEASLQPWEAGAAAAGNAGAPEQPELYGPENGEHVDFWVFLTGMLVRFALILIPALLAYRLLVMLRVAEERRGTDQDRALVAEMLNMEAGQRAPPPPVGSGLHERAEEVEHPLQPEAADSGDDRASQSAPSPGGQALGSASSLDGAARAAPVTRHGNSL